MKIQYISCHSVLEYDEVKLLTDLGFEVYSNGAYRDPKGAYTLPRPGIPNAPFNEEFFRLTAEHPKTNLPPELIDPYDIFIFMAGENEQTLISNWDRIKHKRVIWRSIGQNTPQTERMLRKYRDEGLQIIRYSPNERDYENYAGEDVLIRFYKDPDTFKGWIGDSDEVVNFSQALKGRGKHCHYEEIMGSIVGFNSKVYGVGNNDLGKFNGGEMPFEKQLEILRHARAYVYGGTYPACYTLSLIEAMMLGIPVVAIGSNLAQPQGFEEFPFYEVGSIIEHGVSGFVCDSIQDMRGAINSLLQDEDLARTISTNGRARAIELFGKEKIGEQWKDFLEGGVKV